LPCPVSPWTVMNSPSGIFEIHAAQGCDLAAPLGVDRESFLSSYMLGLRRRGILILDKRDHRGYSTRRRASAGCRRAARQPPMAPAMIAPTMASPTATADHRETERCGHVQGHGLWLARGEACGERRLERWRTRPGKLLRRSLRSASAETAAPTEARGGRACPSPVAPTVGGERPETLGGPEGSATPEPDPDLRLRRCPCTSVSPMTWRRSGGCASRIAFRVPNSRTRR